MTAKKPTVLYRTVMVTCTDPAEPTTIEQQAIIVWDKIKDATVNSEGNEISIVYSAPTRKELTAFLSQLGKALSS